MKNPTLLVVALVLLVIVLIPTTQSIKLLLVLLSVMVLLYVKRAYIYVMLASRALNGPKKDEPKAWAWYEKGAFTPLPSHYTLMLNSLFLQKGDPHVALRISDFVIQREQKKRKPSQDAIISAKISKAMAKWIVGEKEETISILQEMWDEGVRDPALLTNYGIYLIESGKLDELEKVIQEGVDQGQQSAGMLDNHAHYLFLQGEVKAAQEAYHSLFEELEVPFCEAYYHAALVELELQNPQRAKQYLREALSKPITQLSSVTEQQILSLLQSVHSTEVGDIEELTDELFDYDMFDDALPNIELDDDDDIEPNIELEEEDLYDYEQQEEPQESVEPTLESVLFSEDEYDDEE
jgi:hypothetical protein